MTQADALARLQKRLERERSARKQAEQLLEQKSLSLYESNQHLAALTENLEQQVKQRTQELSMALQNSEAGVRAQRQFLAMMSHEIRTPLHGMLGLLDLVLGSNLNQSQKDHVETIRASGLALLRLLNDVLELSKIKSEGFDLESEPFSMRNLLQSLVKLYQPLASGKHLKLDYQDDLNINANLVGDESRVRQVLSNLLSNAIKFTERGQVRLSVRSAPVEGDPGACTMTLVVEDTGIGIAPEQMPRLFNEFAQADTSIHRRFGGTGLGLVIAKKLIESMGGQLTATSQLGQGSVFTMTLNFKCETTRADAQGHPGPTADQSAPPVLPEDFRVLVVDDNQVNRMLLGSFLQRVGVTAQFACDGLEAVEFVKHHGPVDLVFMDLIMPNLDGLEATAQIRLLNGIQPRVCGLSANAFKEDQQKCLSSGMDDFLHKPLSFAGFCNYMRQFTCAKAPS